MKLLICFLGLVFSHFSLALDSEFELTQQLSVPVSAESAVAIDQSTDLPDALFGITLFSLGGFTDSQFKGQQPAFDLFDNYISFNYKVSRNFRISARPAFGYTTSGFNYRKEEVTNSIRTRDFSLVAKFTNIFQDLFAASFQLAHQFRLYLPTSDYSKETGMIARLRYEIEGRYSLSKSSSFRIYTKPSYFFQRASAYLDNSNPQYPYSVKTTPKVDLEQGAEMSFYLNSKFAVKPGFEFQEKWSNTSAAENKDEYHGTTVRTGVGLEIRASREINFTVGIDSTRDLIAVNRSPETGYTLMTNMALY